MKALKVGVVGAGHLGSYHAEKFHKMDQAQLVAICDPQLEKAQALAQQYSCKAYGQYQELTGHVEAVLIATPTPTHFQIGKHFLEHQTHLLIEKPITTCGEEARQLCQLASENHLVLQVGHVERFNPVFLEAQKAFKKPFLIEAHRLAPFKPRGVDVDVVLDLMIHDLDLIMSLVESPLARVEAVGSPVVTPYVDLAQARLEFESGVVANLKASRVSREALRRLEWFTGQESYSLDLGTGEWRGVLKQGEWLKASDPSPFKFESHRAEKGDALMAQDQSFVDCVLKGQKPVVSGQKALTSMKWAEQIQKAIHLRLNGKA